MRSDDDGKMLAERLLISDYPEAGMLFYNHNHDGRGRFSSGGGGRVVSREDVGHAAHAHRAAAKRLEREGKRLEAAKQEHARVKNKLDHNYRNLSGENAGKHARNDARLAAAHQRYAKASEAHAKAAGWHAEVARAHAQGLRWGGGSR